MKALFKIHGFPTLTLMIFINAFIDLGHKITIQNTIFKVYDDQQQVILTAVINAFILLPYIFFYKIAGIYTDKNITQKTLQKTALAVVLICTGITISYYFGQFEIAFALTLLLATQSAFYGPAKYTYLKEISPNTFLTAANGITQSAVTIAILISSLFFSVIFESLFPESKKQLSPIMHSMFPIGIILIALSLIEYWLACRLPTHEKQLQPTSSSFRPTQSRPILLSILALCVFWSVGQLIIAVYPAHAKANLGIDNTIIIQGLVAIIAIGIVIGSLLAGKISSDSINLNKSTIMIIGIASSITALAFSENLALSAVAFFILGISGGAFVAPLNALLQYCSPPEKMGNTIAVSNLIQNIAMTACLGITITISLFEFSTFEIILLTALLSLSAVTIVKKLIIQPRNSLLSVQHFNQTHGYGNCLFITDDEKALQHLQSIMPFNLQKFSPASIEKCHNKLVINSTDFERHEKNFENYFILNVLMNERSEKGPELSFERVR